jgi:uncharacterized protein YdeI (YjbR/CyaY-like superfamily)
MDPNRFEHVEVQTEAALWAWLADHHMQTESVWLVTWKAQHRDRYVSREAVLDALIAHGWIDGRRMKLDDDRTMQLISPRQQQAWAQSYKTRAARLEAAGRMHPGGRAAVERGRKSGLWRASDPIDALIDPDDLLFALEQGGGLDWWQAAAPSYRRNILRWIAEAKQPKTRASRLAIAAAHAARGEKVPQY